MTLRELRAICKEKGISYEKTDTVADLQDKIAGHECESAIKDDDTPVVFEVEAPAPAVKRAPVAAAPALAAAPAIPEEESVLPDYMRSMEIHESDLIGDFKEHSANVAYYSDIASKAGGKAMMAKLRMEIVEAELFKFHRDAMMAGPTKPTEAMIKAEIHLDPRYFAAKTALNKALEAHDYCKGLVTGLTTKTQMLIITGNSVNQEKRQIGLDSHAKVKELLAAS